MNKILLDTDVLIDFSKGYSHFLEELLKQQFLGKVELYVNPVVIAEFFTDKNLKNQAKLKKAFEFFNLFGVKDINKKVGLLAGELLRENKAQFLGDALVAATCLVENLQLATNNDKHFSKIEQLKFLPNLK